MLLAVAALAAWPVTAPAAGYTLAWLRGWPPVRLYRAAWTLLPAATWLAALEIQAPGFLAARDPGQTWARGWAQPDAAHLAGVFAALAPVTLPAGLALAGLIWAWRNYAVTAGLGGIMASAPITFDARQWRRQAAFDIQVLWNKPGCQATVHAEITDATLKALPAILNPGQDGYDDTSEIVAGETESTEDLFEALGIPRLGLTDSGRV